METTTNYRSLTDVYPVLRDISPLAKLALQLGITRMGVKHKFYGSQFFTEGERKLALKALESEINLLVSAYKAIETLPVKVG